MFMRIANTMINNLGKLSVNQRKFIAKQKGKFTKEQVEAIREIHRFKGDMMKLDKAAKHASSYDYKESAGRSLDKLQSELHSVAWKASGKKMRSL